MKKRKFISSLLIASLLFGTLGVNATSITFDDLEQSDKTLELKESEIVDNDSIQIEMEELESVSDNSLISFDELETNISEANTLLEATNYGISTQSDEVWNFEYTGEVEEFVAPYTGKYYLETWGASGGGVLSKGGYSNVYVNLYAGDKIYICVGEKGYIAPEDGKAEGGYNGGGAAWYGAGSGGGATSITKTNRGELKNFEEYQDEILVVAGGSGGKGSKTSMTNITYTDDGVYRSISNYYNDDTTYREIVKTLGAGGGYSASAWVGHKTEYDRYESLFGSYKFGIGEDGTNVYNSGYSGAGGGGFVGGTTNYLYVTNSNREDTKYNKSVGIIGGGGGSGFTNDIIAYDGNSIENINEGNGKAKISWKGEVETTLIIDTKNHATINNQSGKVEIKGIAGTSIDMPQIVVDENFKFYNYKILYGDDFDLNSDKYEFKFNDTFVELQYINPLILELDKVSQTEYNLHFTQDDNIKKIFRVLQSYDGENWIPVQSNKNKEELKSYAKSFSYTGNVQSYTAPIDGYYYIEATGGSGGACARRYTVYSNSGFTSGYRYLKAGQTVYVAVGGKGGCNNHNVSCAYADGSHQTSNCYRYAGGWNGGGSGFGDQCPSGGGGATSWTLTNRGELRNFSSYRNEVIAVAGGGGGGNWGTYGNAGGGLSGQGHSYGTSYSTPGGQTSGYAFGYGESRYNLNDTPWADAGGGGGGWYGGTADRGDDGSGAGGSGYIGGLFNAQTILGGGSKSKLGTIAYGTAYIDVYEIVHNNNFINDIILSDKAIPNTPSNGKYNSIDNTITITWDNNGDNGTDVMYKVISYKEDADISNPNNAEKLNESNTIPFDYTSGVKGFYYYIDNQKTGTVDTSHTFIEEPSIHVSTATSKRYLHVAAIDNAGNISDTYTMEIPSVASYTVKYYKMDLNGNYVLDETVTDTATIGTEVTPEVKEYTGFTSPQPITKTVLADGSTLIEYYYERNKYTVTYIDRTPDGKEIGRTTKLVCYDADVRGSELGDNPADNTYHLQYKYISDTTATVTTDGATVYRIFEFCETEATFNLKWNDNNNFDGFRPQKYKLKLKQNGKVINEVELPSETTDYTFHKLPKYDEAGNPYHYTFDVEASDRYQINFDNDGNLIIEDYQPANFSVIIPKQIVLDGRTGEASYTVSVNGAFYYNDTLTVIPNNSLTLTDRSNISQMKANVLLTQTQFKKEDVSSVVNGTISTNKKLFAGSWRGNFNFNIKFVMSN